MIKHKGFTMIELMVAIVLYGIVMTAVLGSFWNLVQTRERADRFRNLQKELHFVMIKLADNIRAQSVDYDRDDPSGAPISFVGTTELLGVKPTQQQIEDGELGDFLRFQGELNTVTFSNERNEGLKEYNVLINDLPLLSSKVQLNPDKANYFRVYPTEDPFANLDSAEQQVQPRVEIFLSIQDTEHPDLQLTVKTTVSSRRYSP